MNKIIFYILISLVFIGCEQTEKPLTAQNIKPTCQMLAKGYLHLNYQDYREITNKVDEAQQTIHYYYRLNPMYRQQILVNPQTILLECKMQNGIYTLSEINQNTAQTRHIFTVLVH